MLSRSISILSTALLVTGSAFAAPSHSESTELLEVHAPQQQGPSAKSIPENRGSRSFDIQIPQARLDRIQQQVAEHSWLEPADIEPWQFGIDQAWMRELGAMWANDYDWRRVEEKLNRFDNRLAEVDGKQLHFIFERGSGENPTPLILLHGWPYSVYSFTDVIEPLAHPERFGGDVADAYDVVVVSAPGFGWSEAPDQPESLRDFGRRYHALMTEVLGYRRYITHGGDQGAISAAWMAKDFPNAVMGHHVHMFYPRHAEAPWLSGQVGPNPTEAEQAFMTAEQTSIFGDLAYILTHVARGETLAAALQDNPVGQAAWMWDKWYYWTDRRGQSLTEIIPAERLIDEAMIYIVTDTFRTSMWPYMMISQENITTLEPGEVISNPAGVTAWPDPVFPLPPREFVERSRSNLIHYTTPAQGGHFPMIEQPTLYVEDLREFGRMLREMEAVGDARDL